MYDPELLRTFLAVAQTLSFTQAAQNLGVRQPTVSQHVRKLELAVGRALFIRDTRTVTLTADGEAMAGFARAILSAHEQATGYFTGSGLRGRLRFGVSDDLALTPLPRIPGASHDHDAPRVPGQCVSSHARNPGLRRRALHRRGGGLSSGARPCGVPSRRAECAVTPSAGCSGGRGRVRA